MTESDENLLAAAKLREAVRGDLDHGDRPYDHAGVVHDPDRRQAISFMESLFADGVDRDGIEATAFADTALGQALISKELTDGTTEAVKTGNGSVLAHHTGITEMDLDGSSLRLPMRLNSHLDNNGATAFVVGAGNPNTGKTNTMSLLVELRDYVLDDLLVLSNVRSWDRTDHVVTSAHDLAVTLLEHRDVPKVIVLDEASTHLDSRTNRREVATQWTPLAKRFSKINVDTCGVICHTGKDLHPEAKRLATLCFYKTEPAVAEFYERWPADADFPADRLFGGSIDDLEPTGAEYDPDDAAPWSWNLKADLFAEDLEWSELLDELKRRGPES
jgi:hypothetical protein